MKVAQREKKKLLPSSLLIVTCRLAFHSFIHVFFSLLFGLDCHSLAPPFFLLFFFLLPSSSSESIVPHFFSSNSSSKKQQTMQQPSLLMNLRALLERLPRQSVPEKKAKEKK
jgi:hypothetical protein